MIRALLTLVLLVLVACPWATAQVRFAPGAGLYATVSQLDLVRGGDGERAIEAGAGWRFGSGIDLGVHVEGSRTQLVTIPAFREGGTERITSFGVEVGYTRWLSDRTGLRLGAAGRLDRILLDDVRFLRDDAPVSYAINTGAPEASLTAFHRMPVYGSVSVQPTVGVYAAAYTQTVTERDRAFTLRVDSGRKYGGSEIGLELGVPVVFRVLGTDAALDLRARPFSDLGQREPRVSARLHLNF